MYPEHALGTTTLFVVAVIAAAAGSVVVVLSPADITVAVPKSSRN